MNLLEGIGLGKSEGWDGLILNDGYGLGKTLSEGCNV